MELPKCALELVHLYSRPILRYPSEYNKYVIDYKEWSELKNALSGSNADTIVGPLRTYMNAREALRTTLRERTMITSETYPDVVLKWEEQDRNSRVIKEQLQVRDNHYLNLRDLVNNNL